jgi:hypothetical protein
MRGTRSAVTIVWENRSNSKRAQSLRVQCLLFIGGGVVAMEAILQSFPLHNIVDVVPTKTKR